MSSTSVTEFYGLTQYVGTDKPSFTDNNEAFRAIDGDLHQAVVGVADQAEAISAIRATVASLGDAVVTLQGDLNTEKGKIVNLQNKETLQDAEIADVKADAQNMITAYVEATAESAHAYNAGDYFIYNDVLYKATDTIAIGATIVPDVNCTTDNVSTELKALKSEISNKLGNIAYIGASTIRAEYADGYNITATIPYYESGSKYFITPVAYSSNAYDKMTSFISNGSSIIARCSTGEFVSDDYVDFNLLIIRPAT